ncbi:MAG: hypothetical protein K8R54_15685 [Bacteroidales bacterium]|nr:hypothetical protein [Bacteroidales bacterium]
MSNFAIQKINEITGKIKFYKLLLGDTCEFDEFWEAIEKSGNLNKELIKMQTLMQEVSEMNMLPATKFKSITPKKETIKEYEVKTKNLRLYMFHEEHTGRIIVCGGKKSTQPKDIKHFRKIKKQYFEEKQT